MTTMPKLDKSFTDQNGAVTYARKPGEKPAPGQRAAQALKKRQSKLKSTRTSAASSLYEDWMEPGGAGRKSSEVDPWQLGLDEARVNKAKKVPKPNKSGPTGKYRFNNSYLTDVQSDDEVK